MKKILVRVGFVVAVAATVASGVGSAGAIGGSHDSPQATKQWCC